VDVVGRARKDAVMRVSRKRGADPSLWSRASSSLMESFLPLRSWHMTNNESEV